MWIISDLELNLTIYYKGQTVLESVLILVPLLYPLECQGRAYVLFMKGYQRLETVKMLQFVI